MDVIIDIEYNDNNVTKTKSLTVVTDCIADAITNIVSMYKSARIVGITHSDIEPERIDMRCRPLKKYG